MKMRMASERDVLWTLLRPVCNLLDKGRPPVTLACVNRLGVEECAWFKVTAADCVSKRLPPTHLGLARRELERRTDFGAASCATATKESLWDRPLRLSIRLPAIHRGDVRRELEAPIDMFLGVSRTDVAREVSPPPTRGVLLEDGMFRIFGNPPDKSRGPQKSQNEASHIRS